MVCGPDFGNHCTRPWLFPSILDLKISFDYQIIILTNFFVSKRPAQIKRLKDLSGQNVDVEELMFSRRLFMIHQKDHGYGLRCF